jgi:hypothetical protein
MEKVTFHDLVSKLKELAHELGRTPTLRDFVHTGISKRQIDKYKYSKIVEAAGLEQNPSPHTSEAVQVITGAPKVLIFDLEVAPAIAYTYNFREAFINPENIIQMPYILSYAAKWLDSDEIFYGDTRNTPKNDKHLLDELGELINEAHWVVGHNMKKFDLPTAKGRMIIEEMLPVKDIAVFDTFKIAFKHFKFPFYKLGELAKYLKCEKEKLSHSRFPGTSLFTEADKGNPEAFIEMEEYCKMDVIVTEEVFKKLMPWEPSINFGSNFQKAICVCGGEKFYKNGIKYLKSGAFQIWRCVNKNCGKHFVGKDNLLHKDIRKQLLK